MFDPVLQLAFESKAIPANLKRREQPNVLFETELGRMVYGAIAFETDSLGI
ncbi:MAG: hypothetical protein P4L26_14715 [Terracidiphilus sp.]|nr:hypothetical protein [Terracidiphilus sp.]